MTFTSVTALDPENRRLLISERHELIEEGAERISDYDFVMRCREIPPIILSGVLGLLMALIEYGRMVLKPIV